MTKPETTSGLPAPDAVRPPGLDVAVNFVIAELPLLTGAAKEIVALPEPFAADTPVGGPGTVGGAATVNEIEVETK